MSLIPPVGTEGIYQLRAPFASLMRANTSYRCDATRYFSEIAESGGDVFESFYEPRGISRQTYDQENHSGVAIVSLVSASGHWIHVPSTYVASYPNQGGIPYRGIVLSVPLGPVPTTMDLAHIKTAVQNLVTDVMGIRATAQTVAVTEVQPLALTDHNAIQTAREHAMANSTTDSAKARMWEQRYQELLQRYRDLEAYVLQNQP